MSHRSYRSHHRSHGPHRSHHRRSHSHHRRWHRSVGSHHHRTTGTHRSGWMHTGRRHHARWSLRWYAGSRAEAGAEIRRRRYRRALVGCERIRSDLTGLESGGCRVDQMLRLLLHPLLIEIFNIVLVLATLAVGLPHARRVVRQVSVAIVAVVLWHRCRQGDLSNR